MSSVARAKWLIHSLCLLTVITVLYILYKFESKKGNYHILQRETFSNSSLSVNTDVIGVSAYFDDRPQDNHSNVTVILASVLQKFEDTIVGCNVDGEIRVKPEAWTRHIVLTGWIQEREPVSHVDMIVRCYDMEVSERSLVSLLYVINGTRYQAQVKTSLVIPEKGPARDGVMICASGYGNPNYLDEWLTYQKTIGVKFIHINAHTSFLESVNKSPKAKEFMKLGYLNILVWEEYLNKSQIFYYSQTLKYQDCIHRYLNSYKYMMIIDFDEYFIPLKSGRNIDFYIQHLFSKKNTGSVEIVAIQYSCKSKLSDNTLAIDGNLTRIVNITNHEYGGAKSIHLVRAVQEVSVHSVVDLLPPYKFNAYWSTRWINCYFAHIKGKDVC